jgi:hypothetical protein
MAVGIVAVYHNVFYNDKLKKGVVRIRNAQKDPKGKPVGMRPL